MMYTVITVYTVSDTVVITLDSVRHSVHCDYNMITLDTREMKTEKDSR